ncbi:FlgB family protein [Pseudogemmobacter sonorensis]|uniref:FlgB family protein n=1 Tax=Pseudogemmobacter sonorensis TaxID=2989681 RepID=UPI0036A4E983
MFEKLELSRMAQALAAHAGSRMGVIARNVSNADTPGYKARDLTDFATVWQAGSGEMRATRPGHTGPVIARTAEMIDGRGSESPNGNTVSLEMEMVKSASARQDHEMALAIYRASSGVIRSALGRN